MTMHLSQHLLHLYLCCCLFYHSVDCSGIHLPLTRRGGRFARHESVNLTLLSESLKRVEQRYDGTIRDVEDNHLVRRWRLRDDDLDDDALLSQFASSGPWFASIEIGSPPQLLEFDLDMLSPDLYTVMTTSEGGSRYDTFLSKTHGHSDEYIHPLCRNTSEIFHLDKLSKPSRLKLPICNPMKASRYTLHPSGSTLGLAPPSPLSRMESSHIQRQLKNAGTITEDTWSIALLDSEIGILSIGSTIAREMEQANIRKEIELQRLGNTVATEDWVQKEVEKRLSLSMSEQLSMQAHFKWTATQGATGWWTALMGGVWVNGAKILKNQPVLFDVQLPIILAPAAAAARFYEAIGGAFRLSEPHEGFYAFPCLNQVNMAFELGAGISRVCPGKGTRADAVHGPAGVRFSLGKIGAGTGYCLGSVVENKMGLRREKDSSGMQDSWVLGEPFFRGVGVVFDNENARIGLRSY